jgi:hypothetical protein
VRVAGLVALLALLVPDAPVGAQGILGHDMGRRRAIAGVWALHPFEPQFPEVEWTRGWGLVWGQWFGATFINSYDERAFIAGLERSWASTRRGRLAAGVGYRVGIVTGYDERLIVWAEHTPILPFGGVMLWSDLGPLGVDVVYVYRAITFETSIRF